MEWRKRKGCPSKVELLMTANTILADINEIYTGYVLNNNVWFDSEAKRQFDSRVKQAQPEEVKDAIGKSRVMAKEFIKWAKSEGYRLPVKKVWWTARPNSMSVAVGYPVDQKKNPTDILIKFSSGPSDGFLGLSAKATRGKGDIGFKNPGIGTIDRSLTLRLSEEVKKRTDAIIKQLDLPSSAIIRKKYIRENPGIKAKTEAAGVELMSNLSDKLLVRIKKFTQQDLMKYLLSDWMDADIIKPPYVKITGMGNREPYTASSMDPTTNEKLDAMAKNELTLTRVGNESIGVMAGDKKIMKIRFKFESEKMASSMKLSGDPW
jgi:hypothetical protein